ncbi:MAG: DUF1285 domain-containing protein [Deltaproteobacteria bacterium]|nr:DUF1285 domain-containing protein [Deltaproteobacteria bacterium]
MDPKDIPPCMIYIDKEGRWYHRGSEMIHREIILDFYRHMEMDQHGRCIINWNGAPCYVETEDTPYCVRRTRMEGSRESGGISRFVLHLSGGESEALNPSTLNMGKDNILYCKVRDGIFPARFSRAAYYQLAEYIEEENGRFFLPVNGEKYYLD